MIIAINGRIGSGKDTVAELMLLHLVEKKIGPIHKSSNHDLSDLESLSHWQIKKFASKLKQIVSLITNISLEDLERQEVKDSFLDEEWDFEFQHDSDGKLRQRRTVRWMLQTIGTEAMRDAVHQDIWINALMSEYKPIFEHSKDLEKLQCITTELNMSDKYNYSHPRLMKEFSHLYPNWIITDLRFKNEFNRLKEKNAICIHITRENNPYPISDHPSETELSTGVKFDYIINNDGDLKKLKEEVIKICKQLNL